MYGDPIKIPFKLIKNMSDSFSSFMRCVPSGRRRLWLFKYSSSFYLLISFDLFLFLLNPRIHLLKPIN